MTKRANSSPHPRAARQPKTPLAVAELAVTMRLSEIRDLGSDVVHKLFFDGGNLFGDIEKAASQCRAARIAAGKERTPDDEEGRQINREEDRNEASFALGFALGARLGGAR